MTLTIGYCCINTILRKQNIFCSRTCRLNTIQKNGIKYSYELAKQNLNDLKQILLWNNENKIHLYRMSSDMFPFATHPDYYKEYDLHQFTEVLSEIGQLAKQLNQTLTFHPGQFTQISSHRPDVVEKSIVEVDFHAKVMDMMNLGPQGLIVIHGGSKNGGKTVALERFKSGFEKLSSSSKKRLIIENCEMAYSVADLLPLSQELSIPIVLDYHHHNINPGPNERTLQELTSDILKVWKQRQLVPLFHLSESRCGVKITDSITKRRAHSDFVETLPDALLELIKEHDIYLDIEAKMKEQAVMQLYKKYESLFSESANQRA